ncbi:MAG TPA: hypothetical protein VK177_04855 [Flavobacteriales bacterium]|nr:hypothetical protein [Flavobacteriales bacterium]
MKKQLILLSLLVAAATHTDGQKLNGLKDKLGKKDNAAASSESKGGKIIKPYGKDFTDSKGISGTYFCSPAMPAGKDKLGRDVAQDQFKWEYIHEESGKIVVKLNMYYNEEGKFITMYMIEKYNENFNIKAFKSNQGEVLEIDTDVYAFYDNELKKVAQVFAKDRAKFDVYDIETATAKYDQKKSEIGKKESEKEAQKWMNNETYKALVGKVNFVDHYSKVSYNRTDLITEKADVYVTTWDMGKPLYHRAYYKAPITATCGSDCEFNTVYEMEGIKTSRVELSKKSSKWSENFKKREANEFFFSPAWTLQDDKVWDYAYIYCLYQNRSKFVDGKSYKMKVTFYSNRDGVDKDVMAEGTITLVYKKENKEKLDLIFQQMDNFLAE